MTVNISKIPKLSNINGEDSDDLLSFPATEGWEKLLKFISEDGPWNACWALLIWRLCRLPPTQSRLVETVCSLFGIIFSMKMCEHQIPFQALLTLTVIVANYQRTVEINGWIPNKWPLRTKNAVRQLSTWCVNLAHSLCLFFPGFSQMLLEEEQIFLVKVWRWGSRGIENQATILIYAKSLCQNHGERLQNRVLMSERDLRWLFAQEVSDRVGSGVNFGCLCFNQKTVSLQMCKGKNV